MFMLISLLVILYIVIYVYILYIYISYVIFCLCQSVSISTVFSCKFRPDHQTLFAACNCGIFGVLCFHVFSCDFEIAGRTLLQADQSGTIEAAEFIGPLSRWAHDSKTAPRFIKYNMLQTMQLQEDLYDMCADCFRHLALQIDKVSVEVKGISRKMAKGTKSEKSVTPKGSHCPDRAERDRRSNMRVSAMSATSGMEHGEVGQSELELKPLVFEAEATEAEAESAETIRVSKAERISVSDVFPLEQAEHAENHDFEEAVSPQASEKTGHSRIFDMDLHSEMEHVMAMRPSLQPTMLTETLGIIFQWHAMRPVVIVHMFILCILHVCVCVIVCVCVSFFSAVYSGFHRPGRSSGIPRPLIHIWICCLNLPS